MALALDTRDSAYHSLEDLGQKQAIVLAAIRRYGPISDRELARRLEWPINRTVPRRNELTAQGRIERAGTGLDAETGKSVALWRVVEAAPAEPEQPATPAPATVAAPRYARQCDDYGKRLTVAHNAALEAGMGKEGYWRPLYIILHAAVCLDELKEHWEYCYRVCDRADEKFKALENLKDRKKRELAA